MRRTSWQWGVCGGGSKSQCFFSPLINHPAFSFSFVQVALWRVMPLKCQLSVWTCVALDMKRSAHKNSSQSYTEGNKIWSLHFLSPRRPPCTYYLSEWQMFFKWWRLMWAELLPKLRRERLPDVIHHLMAETSTESAPSAACEAFCVDVFTPGEEEVVRVVCRGRARTWTVWIMALQNQIFALKCSEVVLEAATNIVYSSGININTDRKTNLQVTLQMLRSTKQKEVILLCAFFKLRVWGKHSGGIIQLK